MSTLPSYPDKYTSEDEIYSIAQVAELLDAPETRVEHLLKQRQILAVRRDKNIGVPALFFTEQRINKHVPGIIAVLEDGGYRPTEILKYLFSEDESLPGRPIDVLQGPRAREVMRRAQAMAF
ncbi:MAG: Rv2175c family DNA-binding protein [Lawsonella sp.]|nr:DNA-binding protein [Mycobacteriales bacterium]